MNTPRHEQPQLDQAPEVQPENNLPVNLGVDQSPTNDQASIVDRPEDEQLPYATAGDQPQIEVSSQPQQEEPYDPWGEWAEKSSELAAQNRSQSHEAASQPNGDSAVNETTESGSADPNPEAQDVSAVVEPEQATTTPNTEPLNEEKLHSNKKKMGRKGKLLSYGGVATGLAGLAAGAAIALGGTTTEPSGAEAIPSEEATDEGEAGEDLPPLTEEVAPPLEESSSIEDETAQENQDEQTEEAFGSERDMSIHYWTSIWETDAEVIQGPAAEGETLSAFNQITADLLGKLAALRQAENEQEAATVSPIQVLRGATYFIERGGEVIEVSDPIIFGIGVGDGPGAAWNWRADSPSFNYTNFGFYYRDGGNWEHFTITEQNDARWFSDSSAELVGVAYKDSGVSITDANFNRASLLDDRDIVVIEGTDGVNSVLESSPATHPSTEEAVSYILDKPNYDPAELLDIGQRIRSR